MTDLSVFSEASAAVAKVMKDYQPIARLAEELADVRAKLEEVGELEAARERAVKALAEVIAAKTQADSELAAVQRDVKAAQSAYDRIKAALSSVKL